MNILHFTEKPAIPTMVYLGLGSNTGSSKDNLRNAFIQISENILTDAQLSSVYITEPQDVVDQPDFHNAVCCGLFGDSPSELLRRTSLIESSLGRNRAIERRRGPRPIDIDILLFGNYIVNHGNESDSAGNWLKIPHERLSVRQFDLVPLLELNKNLQDPISGLSYCKISESLYEQGIYRLCKLSYIKPHGRKSR